MFNAKTFQSACSGSLDCQKLAFVPEPIKALYFLSGRFIIGKKGDTKKRLEFETKCRIIIPSRGQEGHVGE